MKLYALPEDVINNVLTVLQELPFKTVLNVIGEVQKAKLVVDSNNNPIEASTEVGPTPTTSV